jgi:uncharacterized protein (DUF2236 family)
MDAAATLRTSAAEGVRSAMGLSGEAVPPCLDPEVSALPIGGAARTLHADLASMVIGGVASLFLQSLHPLAVAGVVQHSSYRTDPLGRLQRTANFVGTVTYGTKDEAARQVAMVRRIHARVQGTTADGRRYSALDPDLVTWVHVAEVAMFAAAAARYGTASVTEDFLDDYYAELAPQALALGATSVPTTAREVAQYFTAVRPELSLTAEAREIRKFLLRGVAKTPAQVAGYGVVVAAAIALLPPWARRMLNLPLVPLTRPLLIIPAATAFAATIRLAVPTPPLV